MRLSIFCSPSSALPRFHFLFALLCTAYIPLPVRPPQSTGIRKSRFQHSSCLYPPNVTDGHVSLCYRGATCHTAYSIVLSMCRLPHRKISDVCVSSPISILHYSPHHNWRCSTRRGIHPTKMPMSNLAPTEDLFIRGGALPFPMFSLNEGLQLLHSADAVFPERQDLFGTVSCHHSLVLLLFI